MHRSIRRGPSCARTSYPRGAMRISAVVGLLALACADGGERPCRVGADCESGVCLADGRCAQPDAGMQPMQDAGMSELDAGMPNDDAGPIVEPDAGEPPVCNDDAVITAAELELPIGENVSLRIASGEAVDTHGADRPDGTRIWELEGPYTSDEDRNYQRQPLDGAWFADLFPDADYTFPLGADAELLGVFDRTSDALLLAGVVSVEEGLARTELTYDPPVAVWRFPLELGASWEESSTVSGVASGVGAFYTESWSVEVDARGTIGTPAGVRTVLRVNTHIVRAASVSYRRLAFVEACTGTVAQVFGSAGDGDVEPTYASELWRVAP
jgi:hypothetical protein